MRNPLVLSLLYGGASTLLSACGASTPPETAHADNVGPSPAPVTGRYEVHEWGLVDISRDGSIELAAGPGQANLAAPAQPTPGSNPVVQPQPPSGHPPGGGAATRKPVLYFHLLEGEVQVSVGATMTYGSMLERFPETPLRGPDLQWERVELVGRACGATTYPTADSAACQGVADGYCEAAELALYEARDASCLVVGGRDYNHLFYRGGGRGLSLPVTVTETPDGARLANASGHDIPYALHIASGANPGPAGRRYIPEVVIRRFGRVPGGTQAPTREVISVDDAINAVRAELGQLGLTRDETQAFMNAWEQAVFRAPNVGASVVYLLPTELVDAVSTLSLTPAPETTRRAMMVRVEL